MLHRQRAEEVTGAPEPIAVVGLSCRLPGTAVNPQRLWDILEAGGSAWTETPKDRFNDEGFRYADPENHRSNTTNTKGGHFLSQQIGAFDAPFFGIHSVEAKAMDPQQRLLMEVAYESFENAGLSKDDIWGSNTSVYVGQWAADYHEILSRDLDYLPAYTATATGPAISSNRISYHFNLRGPSLTLDTGCSASLVALHQACQSLRSGESDLSLVAGVNLLLDPQRFIFQSQLKMFSNEGKSFPFDSRANGYGRGEGCSVVILERLSSALARGAPIRGVVRGSVVNQDGRTPGITVPSAKAQLEAIQRAYTQIGMQPAADYVEAHGTGTRVGDPLEAEAISQAFTHSNTMTGVPLPIGSIKGNVGHLESAAGLTAVIKGILMLERGMIPPQVNFEEANPAIDLDKLGLRIPLKAEKADLQRISINSFGYGGTNTHLILERHSADNHEKEIAATVPQSATSSDSLEPAMILAMSAASEISVKAMASDLARYLDTVKTPDTYFMTRLASTLEARTRFEYRIAAVAADVNGLREELRELSESAAVTSASEKPRIAFAFSGQGAQYWNMGYELFGLNRAFTSSMQRAARALNSFGCSWDLVEELFRRSAEDSRIGEPEVAQSLSTAIQLALVDTMWDLGVYPSLVVGHSSGEIAGAYCAKLLSHEDAMLAAYHRGRLCSMLLKKEDREVGAMMAAGVGPDLIEAIIDERGLRSDKLRIACYNSPESVTVSGEAGLVDGLQQELEHRGIFNRKLRTSGVGYHSHQMLLIENECVGSIRTIKSLPGTEEVTMISCLDDNRVIRSENMNAAYWGRSLVSPVRFTSAMKETILDRNGNCRVDVVVEIGPHAQLAGPIKQILRTLPGATKSVKYVASLTRGVRADLSMLNAVRSLFTAGVDVDFTTTRQTLKKSKAAVSTLTDLPPYPFDHSRTYWHESRMSKAYKQRKCPPHELLGVPMMGFNPLEPRWTHYLRLDEVPWIRGHVIQGQLVFPGAAYIAMGIEAVRQNLLYTNATADLEDITFENISLGQALVLSEEQKHVEMSLSLRPETVSAKASSISRQEMRVFSVSENNKWTEHCRALVSVKTGGGAKHRHDGLETLLKAEQDLSQSVKAEKFYYANKRLGLDWKEPFNNLARVAGNDCRSIARITPSSSHSRREGGYPTNWLHPGILDSLLFHGIYATLNAQDNFSSTVVPTLIRKLSIYGLKQQDAVAELVCISTKVSSAMQFDVDVYSSAAPRSSRPLISASGITTTPVGGITTPAPSGRSLCHTLQWVPHMDFTTKDQTQDRFSINKDRKGSSLDRLAVCLMRDVLKQVLVDDIPRGFLRQWFGWMREVCSRYTGLGDQNIDEADSKTLQCDLVGVVRGTVPISQVRDYLLPLVWHPKRFSHCRSQTAAYLSAYARQRPWLRVLDLNDDPASALIHLSALRKETVKCEYVLTATSDGQIDAARSVLSEFQDEISFRLLNGRNDLAGSLDTPYDIVLMSNAMLATNSSLTDIQHMKSLLRPGGKLLLTEITQGDLFYDFASGSLEEWWAEGKASPVQLPSVDQWISTLGDHGFGNTITLSSDSQTEYGASIHVFLAQESVESSPAEQSPVKLLTASSSITQDVKKTLARLVKGDLHELSASASTAVSDYTTSVFLPDACEILGNSMALSVVGFNNMKRQVVDSEIVVFVFTGLDEKKQASAPLVRGMCQCLRMEMPETRFLTLELVDPLTSENTIALGRVMNYLIRDAQTPGGDRKTLESDYLWNDNELFVRRAVPDFPMSLYNDLAMGLVSVEKAPFLEPGRALIAAPVVSSSVETIRWVDDNPAEGILGPNSVKIQLYAAGITARDALIATNQLNDSSEMLNQCSGVVLEIGSNMVSRFRVGDQICALYSRSYSNYPIIHGDCCHLIPDDMGFDKAASIPIPWTAAYYALVELGRLQAGETALIHSTGDPVTQAAIALAQSLGAELFVVVDTSEESTYLMNRFRIPSGSILSADDDVAFRNDIMRLTNGRGVNVILGCQGGNAFRVSCDVVAKFGRFVEMGTDQILEDALMPMGFFRRNVTFAYADLALLVEENKPLAGRLLQNVFKLLRTNSFAQIPIETMPIDKIASAFKVLKSEKRMSSLVLTVSENQLVPAIPRRPSAPELKRSAAYLIVGGLAGLGKRICTWLADRGAETIVVASRSIETDPKAHSMAAVMKHRGVRLLLRSCDITSKEQVQTLVASVDVPVRGIIQAAMVLEDCIFEDMARDQWLKALSPKVQGSWNMYQHMPMDNIDFFLMLSSVVAVAGNPGQSNYGAACAFQDSMARHCGALGLPFHSINVGVVAGDGFVSENPAVAEALRQQGFESITAHQLLTHMDNVIQRLMASDLTVGQSTLGLAPSPEAISQNGTPAWATTSATFAHLNLENTSSSGQSEAEQTDLISFMASATNAEEVDRLFTTAILQKLSTLIDVAFDKLSASKSLDSYGVDSLVAVDLRNWISKSLQANVSLLALRSTDSIGSLARLVTKHSRMTPSKVSKTRDE